MLQTQLGLISQSAFAGYPIVSVPAASRPTPGARPTSRSSAVASPRPSSLGYAYALRAGDQAPPRRRRRSTRRAGAACPARASTRRLRPVRAASPVRLTDALIAPVLDLEPLDIAEIKRRFAAGTLTSAQLVKAYLDRIHYVNNQGPGINAVRAVQPGRDGRAVAADTARAAARPAAAGRHPGAGQRHDRRRRAADDRRRRWRSRTSCPRKDAALVTRLKAAGAIILGKANVTELNGMVAHRHARGLRLAARPGAEPVRRAHVDQRRERAARSRPPRPGSPRRPSASRPTRRPTARTTPTNSASIVGAGARGGDRRGRVPADVRARLAHRHPARRRARRTSPAPVGKSVADIASVLSGLVGSDAGDAATAAPRRPRPTTPPG